MDNELRRVERDAALGDPIAQARWIRLCARMGLFFRDFPLKKEILSEAEDAQADFDEIWWHAKRGLRCGLWGSNGIHSFWDVDFKPSVYKAHLSWGHKGSFGAQNSKRRTLRTHRSSKHKARNYRLRAEPHKEVEEAPHERRRKKRFGGKEHREREWNWNPKTERVEVQWTITKPRLDD